MLSLETTESEEAVRAMEVAAADWKRMGGEMAEGRGARAGLEPVSINGGRARACTWESIEDVALECTSSTSRSSTSSSSSEPSSR